MYQLPPLHLSAVILASTPRICIWIPSSLSAPASLRLATGRFRFWFATRRAVVSSVGSLTWPLYSSGCEHRGDRCIQTRQGGCDLLPSRYSARVLPQSRHKSLGMPWLRRATHHLLMLDDRLPTLSALQSLDSVPHHASRAKRTVLPEWAIYLQGNRCKSHLRWAEVLMLRRFRALCTPKANVITQLKRFHYWVCRFQDLITCEATNTNYHIATVLSAISINC